MEKKRKYILNQPSLFSITENFEWKFLNFYSLALGCSVLSVVDEALINGSGITIKYVRFMWCKLNYKVLFMHKGA